MVGKSLVLLADYCIKSLSQASSTAVKDSGLPAASECSKEKLFPKEVYSVISPSFCLFIKEKNRNSLQRERGGGVTKPGRFDLGCVKNAFFTHSRAGGGRF